jgi:hypothetical protein
MSMKADRQQAKKAYLITSGLLIVQHESFEFALPAPISVIRGASCAVHFSVLGAEA